MHTECEYKFQKIQVRRQIGRNETRLLHCGKLRVTMMTVEVEVGSSREILDQEITYKVPTKARRPRCGPWEAVVHGPVEVTTLPLKLHSPTLGKAD